MAYFTEPLYQDGSFQRLLEVLDQGKNTMVHGLVRESTGHFLFSLLEKENRPLFVVAENGRRARELYEQMRSIGGPSVFFYPEEDLNYFNMESLSSDVPASRLQAMQALADGKAVAVIVSMNALKKPLTLPDRFRQGGFTLSLEEGMEPEQLMRKLLALQYERVATVEHRGQFAQRGGIIDIFPMTAAQPARLEFFDIELDSMRLFDVTSQRSEKKIEELEITPCMELILTEEEQQKAAGRLKHSLEKQLKILRKRGEEERAAQLENKFSLYLASLEENGRLDNPDLLLAYLDPSSYASLLDYSPQGLLAFDDLDRIMDKARESWQLDREDLSSLLEDQQILPEQAQPFYSPDQILDQVRGKTWLNMTQILKRSRTMQPEELLEIRSLEAEPFRGRFDQLCDRLRHRQSKGETSVIFAGSAYQALKERFQDHGLQLTEGKEEMDWQGKIILSPFHLPRGFRYIESRFNLVTNFEITGSERKMTRSRKPKSSRNLLQYQDLEIGDLVVHEKYGIGRYLGTQVMEVNGISKDFIQIQYSGSDKLYVPTEDMDLVSKYIGKEGNHPRLSSLGGAEWKRSKARAQKAVNAIAEDLLDLYARRSQLKGHAFAPDSPWQADFEEAFPYEETPSQLRATAEIKEDMESDRPMDRLLCGDVGYGKTEVALRAAFKAIMDGKQVAFLAPTTILVQQHYQTMVERYKLFPVRMEFLSRFKTAAQQKKILGDLARGSVDIIVGTQRLLSRDVQFHDLGLLIVDEEQRFGVKDKEKIKKMKENVDVLTLSATPIPRTLQLSLTGIRGMSLLEEPPEDRYPTSSYVLEWDSRVIREAIEREIDRGGQVYFVHNRVYDIGKAERNLQALVPDARIITVHGQMSANELEGVMETFVSGQADILLSTTIIESGLDIPNANTLVVSHADRMGLAQLYQLKGRIGRSDRRAFAYFTYPAGQVVSESAEKRLKAIRDFSDFGSGYKIAMRDLELRGAGNLLGESQSGHIEAVGYGLYVKMLEEAIRKIRPDAQKTEEIRPEIHVDIQTSAYLPDDYIARSSDKINIYHRIAEFRSGEEEQDLLDELIDRYGDPPAPVIELFDVSVIRQMAGSLGFQEVRERDGFVELIYQDFGQFSVEFLQRLSEEFKGPLSFDFSRRDNLCFKIKADSHKTENVRKLLEKMETISREQ